MGILIFKGLTTRRLYKSIGVKGLISQEVLWNVFTRLMEKGQFKELFVPVK
jgi:hypothetical protein